MGGKIYLTGSLFCLVAAFSGAIGLGLNATRDINILEYPDATKTVVIGQKLELQWIYQMNMLARNKYNIGLYVYNGCSGKKVKLLILLESGVTVSNPVYLPLTFPRMNMELSYDKAKLSIPTTIFDDSTGYGITFEAIDGDGNYSNFEKFTEVNIVEVSTKTAEISPPTQKGDSSRSWPYHFFVLLMLICALSARNL